MKVNGYIISGIGIIATMLVGLFLLAYLTSSLREAALGFGCSLGTAAICLLAFILISKGLDRR